jgi:hypothetical protein
VLKAQDVLVCLYLSLSGARGYSQIAAALQLSIGTAHAAAKRATAARLLTADLEPLTANLLEFLLHGARYVFYPERGSEIRGVATGAAAPRVADVLASTSTNSPVWPSPKGRSRGLALTPLYPTVPEVALQNPALHALLGAVDVLRIGTARERAVAGELLAELLKRT